MVQEKSEEIFSKYAKKLRNALTRADIITMIIANRTIMDPVGWTATVLEWGALWWIAKDDKASV